MLRDPNDFRADEYIARPTCRVNLDTAQTLTTGATTAVVFDGADIFDAFGMHSPTANNTRITFVVPGVYDVGGGAQFEASAVGQRAVSVRVNGATIIQSIRVDAAAAGSTILPIHTIYRFAPGDYIELTAFQNSLGDLDVQAATAWTSLNTKY